MRGSDAASSGPQYHQAASQLQLHTCSAAAPSSSQQRCNSEKLATATGEDAVPPTGLGSDAVSDCSRGPTARTPANSGSSRIEKLSLDAELLSLDDAPRQSVAEVPHHNRHDLLLRVEVRYFTGTSTEVLGTVEGVDRSEESQEALCRVRFSDSDLIPYTSEQLNGLLADGFAKILELEDTESPSGIMKIRKQCWRCSASRFVHNHRARSASCRGEVRGSWRGQQEPWLHLHDQRRKCLCHSGTSKARCRKQRQASRCMQSYTPLGSGSRYIDSVSG